MFDPLSLLFVAILAFGSPSEYPDPEDTNSTRAVIIDTGAPTDPPPTPDEPS